MSATPIRPTPVTSVAWAFILASITGTAGFLIGRFPSIPFLVAVHFNPAGVPNRWQAKSYALMLMPVWVQLTLAVVFGSVASILLWSSRAAAADHDREDADRMPAAAEAVSLIALIWIGFQALTAVQLMALWRKGYGGMGGIYGQALVVAITASIVVGIRAGALMKQGRSRPIEDGPFWKLKVLYFNPDNPALFVPGRKGVGWTLNFGRPKAILLMALVLIVGIGAPVAIVRLLMFAL